MTESVLVITPTRGFGALIRRSLEEAGDFQVALAGGSTQALEVAKASALGLCILDSDLSSSLLSLVDALRAEHPGLPLILLPPQHTDHQPDLSSLDVDQALPAPFYLPDLLEAVGTLLKKGSPDDKKPSPRDKTGELPPAWLLDASLVSQHLSRQFPSLDDAQASLISSANKPWAHAGNLPQTAAVELAAVVFTSWQRGEGSDLARFLRLKSTGSEHMLYATGLGGDFLLTVLYDPAAPFRVIRAQTTSLARALTSTPPQPSSEEVQAVAPSIEVEEFEFDEQDLEELLESAELENLAPLLEDVPPPSPADWFLTPLPTEAAQAEPPHPVSLPEPVSEPEPAADTVRTPRVEPQREIKLEPVSPALYNLTYACVLLPRIPEHHLTGDLASGLADWVTQLCLAFGWRLEHLSIRPEYLHWMVNVPPSTPPGYLMRILRRHTSQRLFLEFSEFEQDNPSGDFWAPGYLIISGPQSPPAKMIKDFIQQTRERQGLTRAA